MAEREKMIKVIKKAFEDCGRMLKEQIPRVLSGEIKKASDGTLPLDEAIADALIAAGLKFDRNISYTATFNLAQLERINDLGRRLAATDYRAEVAEKMFDILYEETSEYMKVLSKEWYKVQAERKIKERNND